MTLMIQRTAVLLVIAFLVCSCAEDVKREDRKAHDNLLLERFDKTFPPAGWITIGPGTLAQDMSFGAGAPSLRLDDTGAQSGLESMPVEAQGVHFSVRIAIDPTPGSGAVATYVLRDGSTSAVVASVTVEEGQITYVMGAAAPVVQAWATDGAFHTFEFQGINLSNGAFFWKRDEALATSSMAQMTSTSLTVGLEGPSSGNAWFDDVHVYRILHGPG